MTTQSKVSAAAQVEVRKALNNIHAIINHELLRATPEARKVMEHELMVIQNELVRLRDSKTDTKLATWEPEEYFFMWQPDDNSELNG